MPLAAIRQGRFAAALAAGSAEPTGVQESIVGQATLGIGGEVRLDAIEEIHVDRIHMLDLNPTARLGLEQGGNLVERVPGDVHAARLAGFLQALRDIGRVAPDVVGEAPLADYAGHQRARADPDAELPGREMEPLALLVGVPEELLHLQGSEASIDGVCAVRFWQPAHAHIGIADGFQGFEPIGLDDLIEAREVLIELLDEASRIQRLGQAREPLKSANSTVAASW